MMTVGLTALGVAAFIPSQDVQPPEYYKDYSPKQIHDSWIDLNNDGVMDPYENTKLPLEQRVEDLLSRMTLDEKVHQIALLKKLRGERCDSCGDGGVSPAIDRMGLPEFSWYVDESLHGVQSFKPATVFPFSIGIAATWNEKLVHEAYSAVGDEFRAAFNVGGLRGSGLVTWSPVVLEIPRNKKYDRSPETCGEDPYLTSRLAVATVRGFQGEDDNIPYKKGICTAKHYVYCNAGSDEIPLGAPIEERITREVIFPPYKAVVREGNVGQIMTGAHGWDNAPHLGGDPINYSPVMLGEVLREQWGFKGIVCGDCGALGEAGVDENLIGAATALNMGVDSNACGTTYSNNLPQAVKKDLVNLSAIDQTIRRMLRIRFQLGLFDPPQMNPYNNFSPKDYILTEKHIALALQVARESIVLLKNANQVLPLDRKSIQSIAVIGPNADNVRSLIPRDYNGTPPYWITPLKGIQNAVASGTEVRVSLSFDLEKAVKAAQGVDVAVVITGPDPAFESTARENLDLPEGFLPLLQAVESTGTPTVAVLVNGTPISSDWMKAHIPAIVEAWYGGMEGGNAIAQVLFGDYNPGGKLPWTYPRGDVGPTYYNYKPGEINYDESTLLWPFGYGLSYTEFEYSNLKISPKSTASGTLKVSLELKNIGKREGDAVVEMYLRDVEASLPVPVKQLRGFKRVGLKPGESKTVEFILQPDDISLLDTNLETIVEPGTFEVMIGESCEDIVLKETFEVTAPIRAKFKYQNLKVSKTKVRPLELFEVAATVIGTGGMEEGDVRLFIDGKPVESKKVCLASGETREISFTCTIGISGAHTVTISDLPGTEVSVGQSDLIALHAQQKVIPLYSGKAPGSENWTWSEKENTNKIWQTRVVYNVSTPTLSVFLPDKSRATGAAVIICPGGGFYALSIDSEGFDVARWLNEKGVAAFVLKYRLAHCLTDNPVVELMQKMSDRKTFDAAISPILPLAVKDTQEAIRYVRSNAAEYGVDPTKIGVMGFSAGGTLIAMVTYNYEPETRPDFAAPIYPYMDPVPFTSAPKEAPPVFIAAATNDELGLAAQCIRFYSDWIKARRSAELHLYAKGGHGFGMRKQNLPTDDWIKRFGEWMRIQGFIK